MQKHIEIALVGRTNVGKSSLINFLTNQDLSIVSKEEGTTTDPVRKAIELRGIGPCVLIDTAGLDDQSSLSTLRIQKTEKILNEVDIALVIIDGPKLTAFDKETFEKLKKLGLPFILLHNKNDQAPLDDLSVDYLDINGIDYLSFSLIQKTLIKSSLRGLIAKNIKLVATPDISTLIKRNDLIMLVAPIDMAAPRDRLILPQVQILRNVLDQKAMAIVVQDSEIATFLKFNVRPVLVVTDSQAFKKVSEIVPDDIPMTSFSILLSYLNGNLPIYLRGVDTIHKLQDNDEIIVMESCSHHYTPVDIGRVQIPNFLTKTTAKNLKFTFLTGKDTIPDLSSFKLAIQCGGCMLSITQIGKRVMLVNRTTPITNYGLVIAHCLGILDRSIAPFKEFLNV
jgi:[FeFe] hydrogenase H-cluster maturation GTPase HydF